MIQAKPMEFAQGTVPGGAILAGFGAIRRIAKPPRGRCVIRGVGFASFAREHQAVMGAGAQSRKADQGLAKKSQARKNTS
jgi:hypothetical protein